MTIAIRDDAFRDIFDAVHDGIFILSPDTGIFIEVNAPGCKMFGYSKAELVGRDIELLSSGVPPYTLDVAIRQASKAKLGIAQTFEWHCKTKDVGLFWAEISIRYTEIGRTPAIVAIVRDITERKRMTERLRTALLAASAANNAKSEFLATMSHELRTPLNAIIGFSDLILTCDLGSHGTARHRDYIGDIHESGLQLLGLIDDLLDLSQIDAGKANMMERDVSLRRVLTEACRALELQAKQSELSIVIEVPIDLPFLYADERRIRQIVLDLLSNALKFTPPAGIITVRVELVANELQLQVSDNGIGIATEDLPKVLERFGQVDGKLARKHKGTGLGMPLVKELAELHGGSMSIESKVNVGTTVTVRFPGERTRRLIDHEAA